MLIIKLILPSYLFCDIATCPSENVKHGNGVEVKVKGPARTLNVRHTFADVGFNWTLRAVKHKFIGVEGTGAHKGNESGPGILSEIGFKLGYDT